MSATPGRNLTVTLGVAVSTMTEPEWTDDLSLHDIASAQTPPVDMSFIGGKGWDLSSYQETLSFVHETAVADDSVLSFTVPPPAAGSSILLAPKYRSPADLTGVPTAGVRTGDLFLHKEIGPEESWDFKLSSDQTSFPGPVNESELVRVDRVGVTNSYQHSPDESLCVRFEALGSPGRPHGALACLIFTGIPGHLSNDPQPDSGHAAPPGDGAYAAVWFADQRLKVYERLSGGGEAWAGKPYKWVVRAEGDWGTGFNAFDHEHVWTIGSDAYLDPVTGLWKGTTLYLRSGGSGLSLKGLLRILQVSMAPLLPLLGPNPLDAQSVSLAIPGGGNYPPTIRPLRFECRRDVRATFQCSRSKYRLTGTLTGRLRKAPLTLFDASNDHPIYVTAFGRFPSATNVTIQLFNEEDGAAPVACTPIGTTSDGQTYVQTTFNAIAGTQQYYAVLTATTSDPFKTPTIQRVTVYRAPIVVVTGGELQDLPIVSRFSLSGAEADPSHETATFLTPDVLNALAAKLRGHGNVPLLAKIAGFDSGTPAKFSVLFRGRVAKAKWLRKGTRWHVYPATAPPTLKGGRNVGQAPGQPFSDATRWGIYQLTCVGEWARLSEKLSLQFYNYAGIDPTDGKVPYLVTTVLRDLFRLAGLQEKQFSLPVSTKRMFVGAGQQSAIIEPYVPIAPLIVQFARDYLGAYVVPDYNATNGGPADDLFGCWRVFIPPSPNVDNTYNYLCRFLQRPPGAGMPMDEGSYPDLVVGGRIQKQTGIRYGMATEDVVPPEGNCVIVDGSDDGSAKSQGVLSSQAPMVARQVIHNWPAANFGQGTDGPLPAPDSDHPDWTNGQPVIIYYQNLQLRGMAAVTAVARRIFDLACHAQKIRCFEAPVVLVGDAHNAADALQIRPRKLQFGDPVLYQEDDGTMGTYFVKSVNLKSAEGGSKNSFAAYELFQIPALLPATTGGIDLQYRNLQGSILGYMG